MARREELDSGNYWIHEDQMNTTDLAKIWICLDDFNLRFDNCYATRKYLWSDYQKVARLKTFLFAILFEFKWFQFTIPLKWKQFQFSILFKLKLLHLSILFEFKRYLFKLLFE